MSYLDNLGMAIDQKASGVTGDTTSPFTRSGNTLDAMIGKDGVVGKYATSVKDAKDSWGKLNDPVVDPRGKNPPHPPSKAEVAARVARATQASVAALAGGLTVLKDALDAGFANLTAPIAAIFPSLPAATLMMPFLGTPHTHPHPPTICPPAPPVPLPSFGPILLGWTPKVLINYMPAARIGSLGFAPTCTGTTAWFTVYLGSSNVFIGGSRAARMTDICKCCQSATGDTDIPAGRVMAAVGKAAAVASKAMEYSGYVVGGLGAIANAAEAAVEDDAAMASAKALAAAMDAAQLAADAAAMAASKLMGKDPGTPPCIGALLAGMPNVLIGGFPMINIPNPIEALLNRLKRYKAPQPEADGPAAGGKSCPP